MNDNIPVMMSNNAKSWSVTKNQTHNDICLGQKWKYL